MKRLMIYLPDMNLAKELRSKFMTKMILMKKHKRINFNVGPKVRWKKIGINLSLNVQIHCQNKYQLFSLLLLMHPLDVLVNCGITSSKLLKKFWRIYWIIIGVILWLKYTESLDHRGILLDTTIFDSSTHFSVRMFMAVIVFISCGIWIRISKD